MSREPMLLALVVRFTVIEPPRGHSEGRQARGTRPPWLETLRFLWTRSSFVHMTVAAGLGAGIF